MQPNLSGIFFAPPRTPTPTPPRTPLRRTPDQDCACEVNQAQKSGVHGVPRAYSPQTLIVPHHQVQFSKRANFPEKEYELTRMLGQGIHGMVWEAVLKRKCRQVAIKFLHRKHLEDLESTDPSQRAQAQHFSLAFTNEIQLLEALCGHPNIIEILGRASDYSHVILEMAETDLDQYLKDCVRKLELVSLERCHCWFQDILSGVAYIHEIGAIHTDLKPANMLIGSKNQIKICDFGSCHRSKPGKRWKVLGELTTLWYRAPELLLGSKEYDEKIDEWAIGCILLEMMCGQVAFKGQLWKILQAVGTPTTKSLSDFQCAGLIKLWPTYQRTIETTVEQYFNFMRMRDQHPNFKEKLPQRKPSESCYYSSEFWVRALGGLFMVLPHKRVSCRKVLSMSLFADSKRRIDINNDGATSRSDARKDHNSSSSLDNKTVQSCETPACPLPQPVTVTQARGHRQGNEIIWFVRDSDSPSQSHTRTCFSCLFPILSSL